MKKRLIGFIAFIFLLVVLAAAGFVFIKNIKAPVSSTKEESVRIEIPSGMSVSGAASLLKEKGLIRNAKLFYYVARYPSLKKVLFRASDEEAFVLRSGIYYISPSMNIVQIQRKVVITVFLFTRLVNDRDHDSRYSYFHGTVHIIEYFFSHLPNS